MSGATPESLSQVVRAGAGAGKTTDLTKKVLDLARGHFKDHNEWPSLVVCTFTRKATEELKERVAEEVFQDLDSELLPLLQSKQNLHISTIHGVLSLFLRQYGHLMGLESGFQVSDDLTAHRIATEVLFQVLKEHPDGEDLLKTYGFQKLFQILRDWQFPKVESPTTRPANSEDQLAALRDLLEAPTQELIHLCQSIEVETESDKWKDYVKSVRGELVLLQSHWNLSQAFESIKALGRRPSFSSKKPAFSENLNDQFKATYKKLDSWATKESFNPDNINQFSDLAGPLEAVAEVYREKLREKRMESGVLDSSDLELLSLEIIRKEPGLAKAFASQWDYWLVDEYQDTSPIQVELMSGLRGDRPVYVVGDPQQSIYLFRGARVEVFDREYDRILKNGGQANELNKNYRSRPELLCAINQVVSDLGETFKPMDPREEEFNSDAEVVTVIQESAKPDVPFLELSRFIQKHLAQGAHMDDFCILARANQTLSRVALQLEKSGLPCSVQSASGFYQRREILDLLSLFKFLVNPHDNHNLVRLLRSPWFYLEDIELYRVAKLRSQSYWVQLKDQKTSFPAVEKLAQALIDTQSIGYIEVFTQLVMDCGILDFSHWHDSTGRRESNIWKLLHMLRDQERKPGFNPVQVFRRFENALKNLEDEGDATASKEPNRINLMTIHSSKGLKFKYVILPELHKAPRVAQQRGHESPFVYDEDTNLWSPIVPSKKGAGFFHSPLALRALQNLSQREQQESLRLLYVAVTRAEEHLCFHGRFDDFEKLPQTSWARHLSFFRESFPAQQENYSLCRWKNSEESLPREEPAVSNKIVVRPPYQEEFTQSTKLRFSVSSLVEGMQRKASAQQGGDFLENVTKAIRAPSQGTLLHEVFENLHYDAQFDYESFLDGRLGEGAREFIGAVDYALELKEPPLAQLISDGHVEWGFQIKTRKGVLEGQIDLWGREGENIWLVDYKSGNPKYVDKALEQLKLYAWALHQAFSFRKINLVVAFPLVRELKIQIFSEFDKLAKDYEL